MKLFSLLATAAALGGLRVVASPVLDEKRDLVCLVNAILINLLTLNHGEEFCAAYLEIQTSTVRTTTTLQLTTSHVLPVETVTTTIVTGTQTEIVTSHITSFTSVTSTVETTKTLTETVTITITSTTTLTPARKRALGAQLDARLLPAIPPYLASFPTPQISAACLCLNLPTPRTTSVVTASHTSTIVSTLPPTTSSITTFTLIRVTITNVNSTTKVQTITNTIPADITVTSTTTAVATESPVTLHRCSNPAVRRPYGVAFSRSIQMSELETEPPTDFTLSECCKGCWNIPNCVAFRWEGSWSDPVETQPCLIFISDTPAASGIANPPEICSLGVESAEQLNLDADPEDPDSLWGIGVCDLAGVQYA